MSVRVKICGITSVEDALAAAEAGADAIGLVFARSPRRITSAVAREIVSNLPPFVCAVGVFVDAPLELVRAAAHEAGLHAVQLHGSESPEYIRGLEGFSVIKAVRVAGRADIAKADVYQGVAIMLDAASPRAAGGTGETFPWDYARELAAKRPVILAGGLNADNVAEAIETVHPWAVDVSSGVESAPGIKDSAKVADFIRRARR